MRLRSLFVVFVCICVITCSTAQAGAKSDFLYLYKSDWNRDNLSYKLLRIVEKTFVENTKSIGTGTIGFQIGLNRNNIIEKIQKDTFEKFNEEYEEFLQRFENRLPENHEQIKNKAEENFINNTWPELKSRLSNPFYSVNLIILGVIIFVVRSVIFRSIRQFQSKVHTARIVLGVAGLAVLILGVYNASQVAGLTRTVTRKFLYESARNFYISQLPELYVEALD